MCNILKELYFDSNRDSVSVFCEEIGIKLDELDVVNNLEFVGKIVSTTIDDFAYLKQVGLIPIDILYLVGNTDRHPENWGFLIDNKTNKYISLYPIMDFNQSFLSYDTLDGANCQTVLPRKLTQREAAIEAVKKIGLRQIREIDMTIFKEFPMEADMFKRRLTELKRI